MEGLTYQTADALLGHRDGRKIANNTYLERRSEHRIAIRLHSTDVVTLTPEWIELDSGGWHTRTTWDRMSYAPIRVSGGRPGAVILLAGEGWDCGGHPYFDGIRLTADATALAEEQPNAPRGIMRPVLTESGW